MRRLAPLLLALAGCGGNPWLDADTAADKNATLLAKGCEALCLSDGGCTPEQAAACFDAVACNVGSSLHRHGGPDLVNPDAGCSP